VRSLSDLSFRDILDMLKQRRLVQT
jgi:hypothetical protein